MKRYPTALAAAVARVAGKTTQAELAALLSVPVQTVHRIHSGVTTRLPNATAQRFAAVFAVDIMTMALVLISETKVVRFPHNKAYTKLAQRLWAASRANVPPFNLAWAFSRREILDAMECAQGTAMRVYSGLHTTREPLELARVAELTGVDPCWLKTGRGKP